MLLQRVTAFPLCFSTQIISPVPSPIKLISNANWLWLLYSTVISAVKHLFCRSLFSLAHYSTLCHLHLSPWLGSSLSLIVSLLPRLSSIPWWITVCLTVLPLSTFTQILSYSLPSHLSLLLYGSAYSSISLPFLLSPTFFCRHKVTKIKGRRRRWKEANLTPTHISSLYFLFFPALATKSESVFF